MKRLAYLTGSLRNSSVYAGAARLTGGTIGAIGLWSVSLRTWRSPRRLRAIGMGLFAAARLAFAEPMPQSTVDCTSANPAQARSLGDVLFERGEYDRAGRCYEVAGEFARANDAFLKAVGPRGEVTARELTATRDKAKAQFSNIGRAVKTVP